MAIDYTQVPGMTPELIAALSPLVDAELGGIVSNRDAIKLEKLGVQEKLTAAEQIAEDARATAAAAKEQVLKTSGDMEGLKKHYEEQLANTTAELTASAKTAKDALTSRDRGDVMNKVMDLVHGDHKWNSEAMLSNMLEIGYNDQNQLTTQFKSNGEVVANNVDEFKSWAGEQDSFKKILKGVDSSGASTTQSQGSASVTNKPYSEMSLQEQIAHNKNVTPQRY